MNILVDLDGTLFECRRRLHQLFCDLVPEEAISESHYWELKRRPTSHRSLLQQKLGWTAEDVQSFEQQWLEQIETEKYLALDAPYSFARQALERMAANAELYLLTARQFEEPVRGQLVEAGLADFFSDMIVTGTGRSKAAAVRERELPISRADVLVGDTGEDVLAARELGIGAVSVTNGFRDAGYLTSYEPDCIYPDLLAFAEARFP
jgi:phosphoglycolate phosphatase-like HAD superfamily hydrolase